MGEKKRRFVVERVKKAKKEKEKDYGPGPDENGEWHLLLLRDEAPYIRA